MLTSSRLLRSAAQDEEKLPSSGDCELVASKPPRTPHSSYAAIVPAAFQVARALRSPPKDAGLSVSVAKSPFHRRVGPLRPRLPRRGTSFVRAASTTDAGTEEGVCCRASVEIHQAHNESRTGHHAMKDKQKDGGVQDVDGNMVHQCHRSNPCPRSIVTMLLARVSTRSCVPRGPSKELE